MTPTRGLKSALVRFGCLLPLLCLFSKTSLGAERNVAVVFARPGESGNIQVERGTLLGIDGVPGGTKFQCKGPSPGRVLLSLDGDSSPYGSHSTLVTVAGTRHTFTFFLRDIDRHFPILIPAYEAAVTEAGDTRTFSQIASDVTREGRRSKLDEIESEPEEGFDEAAAHVRNTQCQTWLGLSRDIRIFSVGERLDWIQPRDHGVETDLPENQGKPVLYNLLVGRGWGARDDITRRLEDGFLPILHGKLTDENITYAVTCFATLEVGPLKAETLRGTPVPVADHFSLGLMFTPDQKHQYESMSADWLAGPEETALYFRAVAANTSSSPRYAFFKAPYPADMKSTAWSFDGKSGFSSYASSGRVFAVSRLNGIAAAQEEISVLVKPGETAVYEFILPHRPVSAERARRLAGQDFGVRHDEVRSFWLAKLNSAARVRLPEKRIEEMVKAGLLHLDLVAYGEEPRGTLAPTIGIYGPIGSESSPIIQFMDSMGWHDEAERSLSYFLDRQQESGFMQNFFGYMLETGSALWSMGEHYRYTRDDEWVRRIEPKLIKACEYIQGWRKRNLRDDLRGRGYGMLEGKTADPEDPFRSFMLNGYHYLGVSRVAEMLAKVDPPESARWRKEAAAMREDIREAAFQAMARSPVIPLGDGTWVPTLPPWVEGRGALMLYAEGGNWFTHGSMATRDSLLGPLYMAFQEVFGPDEQMTTFLLDFHNELMTSRNVAFSQPYYSRHDWVHLRRGEVKPFLKTYYNTVASLADRETYTFWEHFFHASPHKTHEEAWFLMETRWMLYMEHGDTLELLPGVPSAYLQPGKTIELENVSSYFGPLTLKVESLSNPGRVTAHIECRSDHGPRAVVIRLPSPPEHKVVSVEGGIYDPASMRVRIPDFSGTADVTVHLQ